jgi:predicted RNA-binding Zn ribbon-like protein
MTMEPGGRAPAPGGLALVQAFVNTVDLEGAADDLDTPERLRAWLVGHGLLDPAAGAVGEADRMAALEVREALRGLLLAHNGVPMDPAAPALLDRAGARARLRAGFGPDGTVRLLADGDGIDQAVGRLLAAVATAATEGTWQRLKACRRESCRWAFYDHSKNRSGAWCTMAVCGNRAKARTYRRRHGPESPTGDEPAALPDRPAAAPAASGRPSVASRLG